ncbi:SR-related and CTD-associated factor 4-like isoform X1 [Xyrauchen texanus]|uniref:SR-related and CTD-associated factor 4-like isoform X1 n=1 Tax=Xyrauchen texanus TaxID=154827 RepID=UPI002242069A|nr:SR-related and CTD-associated factor 4-like isoform X1 [Xyrauchen texanus]
MDAVNAFNHELFSLMDTKPPISRAKMVNITKSAIKAIKLYKHVVQIVEKFIKKCKPEYKVPGLYVVDSIVRQSRHQFGADKDVFGPRFTKNFTGTFENLCLCPIEDRSKIVRVLNLWQKNGVFKIEVIQPLLDMAAASSSSTELDNGPDGASPASPVREQESHPVMESNSIAAAVPQLQNSDAFAAVAQLIQSSQGQQLQQILQNFQPPGTPQSPAVDNSRSQLHLQAQPTTAASTITQQHIHHATQSVDKKATFDKKLLDRFDYDDEPEAGEESKKDETPSVQPNIGFPEQNTAGFPPANQMQHFHQHIMGISQHQQGVIAANGQVQVFGPMASQPFPGMMPPMGQQHAAFPPQNDTLNQLMAGHQHQEMSMNSNASARNCPDGKRSRSRSGSRSPKRRRSRSNSRSRRMRHRRSRSRSRERRRQSPRSRSQERRDRERERERRQKGLPPVKNNTLSVCSTTLWVGQLDKRTQQQDVACLLEEFGPIDSINMIPPRGCAYIVMIHRQDAYRALQKLSRGPYKVNQKAIKIAWALNKGIKPEFKQHWDVELGVTYIPWSNIKMEDLHVFREGGMLDPESLAPEWRGSLSELEKAEDLSQNGRPVGNVEESPALVPMQPQVPPVQPMDSVGVPPPVFPGTMNIPPPSFPPGVPPPPGPFIRPGFNPMQMPPGFLPPSAMPHMGTAGPPLPTAGINMPPVGKSVEDMSSDPAGFGPRINNNGTDGFNSGNQVHPGGPPGMGMQSPPGLLGLRPGMMPLQRPPGMPPPHMQRFPMPPHRPGMPPMPPQMMPPRCPPQMMHRKPPPRACGVPPPPHGMRGPFPPPRPPFMRPCGPRPEGPDNHEGRPFRGEHPGLGRGRDREQDWFGGRQPFSEGRGGERSEGREQFGVWHEEPEKQGGWDRERERRDWGRSPEGDRDRERERGRDVEERSRRSFASKDREPGTRERSTRWDRDDRLDRLGKTSEEPNRDSAATTNEPNANSTEELPNAKSDIPNTSTLATADSKASEPVAENKSAEQTHVEES